MKVVLIPSVMVAVLTGASLLFAQQPSRGTTITSPSRSPAAAAAAKPRDEVVSDQPISLGELTPTPEMWFYEQQMREYRNPKNSVRRRAEFEADQRQQRIAAMDWYGYSNSRPNVNPMPFTGPGPYSPNWGGNTMVPYQWSGVGRQIIIAPRPAVRGGNGLW